MRSPLFPLILIASLVGCTPIGKPFRGQDVSIVPSGRLEPELREPIDDMVVETTGEIDLEIKCKGDSCPEGVGLLIFTEPPKPGMMSGKVCTGFLVATDRVMTNGHCDTTGKEGRFYTRDRQGKTVYRRVSGPPEFKVYTPGPVDPKTGQNLASGQPDVAIFPLEKPFEEISSFALAQDARERRPEKLYAYVINAHENINTYVLEERVCTTGLHRVYFPFTPEELTDVLVTFDCEIVSGNSGSPLLLSPESREVEAVLLGAAAPSQEAPYSNRWRNWATELRCLEMPDHPAAPGCLRRAEHEDRYSEYHLSMINSLPTGRYPLEEVPAGAAYAFEVFHEPACRTEEKPSEIGFAFEIVTLEWGEWGELVPKSSERREVKAVVIQQDEDQFVLRADWPAHLGTYKKSDPPMRGPREAWPGPFRVDIPRCDR